MRCCPDRPAGEGDAQRLLAQEREAYAADAQLAVGVAQSVGHGRHDLALARGADLLVVGSRGYGPVRSLMFGSTSEYLAAHARCPLLVLPRTAAAPPATGTEHSG